jgi:hypothetical protein
MSIGIFLPIGNLQNGGGGSFSAFDAAIEALLPEAWYRFGTIGPILIDSGSEGINLTNQLATDASAGTALRTTKAHALEVPAWAVSSWVSQSCHYAEAASVMAGLLDISDEMTLIL